jgi:DNA-binding GntR family transcriptional regulator
LPEPEDQKRNGPKIRRPARLADEVHERLYAQLMSQNIPPGARISIDNLVREMGISHTPIREALSRLEAQGLVVKTHLIGYSAANQIDRARLAHLYDLRLLLEPYAASMAATNVTNDQFAQLQALDASMRDVDASTPDGYGAFASLDGQFHDLIAQNSGNELVHEALARLNTHVHLFRLHFHARATSEANTEHGRLLEAIAASDPKAAETAMREHVLASRRRFADQT